jgi:predicted nucleic acid-binding protein
LILLDTNVIVDFQNKTSSFYHWSNELILGALATAEAGVNAVTLAELCAAEQARAENVAAELVRAGIRILDLPAETASICGRAYLRYRVARRKSGGGRVPSTPLPDFFIGAHAQLMGWKLATRDPERFRLYFTDVDLIVPTNA